MALVFSVLMHSETRVLIDRWPSPWWWGVGTDGREGWGMDEQPDKKSLGWNTQKEGSIEEKRKISKE